MSNKALLPFQRHLLSTLIPTEENPHPQDALLILARGLGMRTIIANFLKVYNSSDHLVLVLNANEEEERGLKDQIGLGLKIVAHEMTASVRQEVYKQGGVLSVTSRIMIVDLLTEKIPVGLITGLVILHAETVTPTSNEAFIARIYRNKNKSGFIQAFSDEPEQFTYGMMPLQTTLQQLQMRQVHIWPRFRQEVKSDLIERKVDVQELYQPLSPAMREIQTAILECMDATLSEIKRSNTSLDVEDLNVENALFRSFDIIVRTQLNPVWDKVGAKTKGLVSDLTTLRKLQLALLDYDCVSFNRFLETILSSNTINPLTGAARMHQSPWLMTPAGNTIFVLARERVYIQNKVEKKAVVVLSAEEELELAENEAMEEAARAFEEENILQMMMMEQRPIIPPTPEQVEAQVVKVREARLRIGLPPGVDPVLEEQPKWALLADVLDEIENEMHWAPVDQNSVSNDTILVMCNTAATCFTLSNYLSSMTPEEGGKEMMRGKLRNYFQWKADLGKMSRNLRRDKGASYSTGPKKTYDDVDEVVKLVESPAMRKKREMAAKGQAPGGKRRRIRGGGSVSVGDGSRVQLAQSVGADGAALEAEAGEVADLMKGTTDDTSAPGYIYANTSVTDTFDSDAFNEHFGLLSNEQLVIVRPHTGDDDAAMLEELKPKYIVMYDADPAFVRRVEILRAGHRGLATRVYMLMYKDSVEEQRYLSSIRKEKESFEKLIRERQTMAIPLEAEYRAGEVMAAALRTTNTRVGGGKQARTDLPRVIVDVREFRSSLPCLLHAGHFDVVPLTTAIGDYVITPEMCVERKSLPDLISSFNSGRLYQQCELMTAHYKQPILLIEFDEKRAFSIEVYAEPRAKGSDYTSETDIRSKLVLLTITFPKLKIIWSSSPANTVDIFRDLKLNHDEPDADKAVLVGADEREGGVAAEGTAEAGFNATPQEILTSLPGITSKNYHHVMSRVDTIEDLAGLELKALQELIGVETGRSLYSFMNKEMILDVV